MEYETNEERQTPQLTPRDEAIAQRVAEIVAGQRAPAQTPSHGYKIAGHLGLRCSRCGIECDSNDANPHVGGCCGNILLSHDFHGTRTVVKEVEKLLPHHSQVI